jgi:hypothetical protein
LIDLIGQTTPDIPWPISKSMLAWAVLTVFVWQASEAERRAAAVLAMNSMPRYRKASLCPMELRGLFSIYSVST